jgi:hypothetical protein
MPSCSDGYLCTAKKYWAGLNLLLPLDVAIFVYPGEIVAIFPALTRVRRTRRLHFVRAIGWFGEWLTTLKSLNFGP